MPDARANPRPTELTQPFWDACDRSELVLQHCEVCLRFVHLPMLSCPSCGASTLAWTAVPTGGNLLTFTVVHRTFAPGFENDLPYVVGVAELDIQPGLRFVANVEWPVRRQPELGARTAIAFAPRPDFGQVPVIVPEPETPTSASDSVR